MKTTGRTNGKGGKRGGVGVSKETVTNGRGKEGGAKKLAQRR